MNITFCKHFSNCENIDKQLYFCVICDRYKAPLTIYNSFGDRTPLTLKSFLNTCVEFPKS